MGREGQTSPLTDDVAEIAVVSRETESAGEFLRMEINRRAGLHGLDAAPPSSVCGVFRKNVRNPAEAAGSAVGLRRFGGQFGRSEIGTARGNGQSAMGNGQLGNVEVGMEMNLEFRKKHDATRRGAAALPPLQRQGDRIWLNVRGARSPLPRFEAGEGPGVRESQKRTPFLLIPPHPARFARHPLPQAGEGGRRHMRSRQPATCSLHSAATLLNRSCIEGPCGLR